jgi:GH15 family glucan-1,4-alpha-glucosidase
MRSLITLKSLTFMPTGGIVAAPTTSLPERIGGPHNWDYRFCWVRDATFTLYALLLAGYRDEAAAWRDWLLRSAAGRPDDLQTLYGVDGDRIRTEFEVPWRPGYADSKPVRVGNAASVQLQLDVYGELVDSMSVAREAGLERNPDEWRFEAAIVKFLEKAWNQPDCGIWETRGEKRHFTRIQGHGLGRLRPPRSDISKNMGCAALSRDGASCAHPRRHCSKGFNRA